MMNEYPAFHKDTRIFLVKGIDLSKVKLTGRNCSIRPPGKTPYSLGPNFLSESSAKMTDSVIRDSSASSP